MGLTKLAFPSADPAVAALTWPVVVLNAIGRMLGVFKQRQHRACGTSRQETPGTSWVGLAHTQVSRCVLH